VVNELQAKIRHILEQRGVLEVHQVNGDGSGRRAGVDAGAGDGAGEKEDEKRSREGQEDADAEEDEEDFGLLQSFEPWTSAQRSRKKSKEQHGTKDKTSHGMGDDEFKNLSEQEKMDRYRKIYKILQQFVNDEVPTQS